MEDCHVEVVRVLRDLGRTQRTKAWGQKELSLQYSTVRIAPLHTRKKHAFIAL